MNCSEPTAPDDHQHFAGLLRAKKENARTVHRPSAFCGDVFAAVNLSPLRYGCRVGERRLHPPQTPPSRRLGSAPVPACLPRLVWRCAKMAARHKGNARKELVQCDTPPLFPSKGNDRECRARQGHFSTEQTGKQERCYLCKILKTISPMPERCSTRMPRMNVISGTSTCAIAIFF